MGVISGTFLNSGGSVRPGLSGPGILTINGNYAQSAPGRLDVDLNGTAAGTQYDRLAVNGSVSLGGPLGVSLGYAPAQGDTFVLIDNDGSDPVTGTFDGLPEGAVLVANGRQLRISYAGGSGNDVTLTAIDAAPTADPPGLTAARGTAYTLTGAADNKLLSVTAGTVTLSSDLSATYPTIRVEASGGAAVVFAASQHLAGLTLSGGATATLAGVGGGRTAANHRILVVGSLSIDAASGSALDLADNDLILKGGGAAGLAGIQSLISAGYNKHNWNGNGIITSTAAGKTSNALGYLLNDGSNGIKAKATFGPSNAPETVGATDVLVKYTWEGDSNLDGQLSFDDYFYIDSKYPRPSNSTWVTGDFDYNAQTSFDDYFYIDSNYPRNTAL